MPPEPSEHTVAEIKDWVREHDPSNDVLRALYRDEREGGGRVTLTGWLESRADGDPMWDAHPDDSDGITLGPGDIDSPADPADAAPARQGPPRKTDTPTLGDDDYDPATHNAWAPGEVPNPDDIPLVVVQPAHRGMIAGYHFEYTAETCVAARTRRVDDAIVDGDLQYVRDAPAGTEDGERL